MLTNDLLYKSARLTSKRATNDIHSCRQPSHRIVSKQRYRIHRSTAKKETTTGLGRNKAVPPFQPNSIHVQSIGELHGW